MIKEIITINGQEPAHFSRLFDAVANEKGCASSHIVSNDCLISVGHETDLAVAIVNQNKILPTSSTGYLLKRTNKDTYRTYLLGLILNKQTSIFVDEANLLSDKTADKITMMVSLSLAGIKVPSSMIVDHFSYLKNQEYLEKHISFPAVVKKTGSKGKQVWKVNDKAELEKYLFQDKDLGLIQEYVPNDHDFRVFVMDNEVLLTIKRSSADGFYNNVSQGGSAERVDITEEEKAICIKAAEIARLRLAGVDMVRTPKGPLIFEVNKTPQLDIFSPAAGFDIEEDYSNKVIDYLMRDSK